MSSSGSSEQQRSGDTQDAATGPETSNLETGAGQAVMPETSESSGGATAVMTSSDYVDKLQQIRARVMPILQAIKREYTGRARAGHPLIIDNVQRGGVFGLTLDAGYGVYFMTDGSSLYGELHYTSLRWDTLSAANAEKFGGRPAIERREIDESWTDADYRNLVSQLLNKWNYQQLRIYRVDS